MKIRSLKCTCDRCNKEISEKQHDDNYIELYASKTMYGNLRCKQIHLCNDCLKEVFNFTEAFLKEEK
jgi:hypothetical protein